MAKSLIDQKLENFNTAASIIAILLLAAPYILAFIKDNKDNEFVVSLTVAIVLLFSLAPIPAVVEGLIAFIAKSNIPVFSKLFGKFITKEENRVVQTLTFFLVGAFIVIPISVFFQMGAMAIGVSKEVADYLPLALLSLLLLFTIWLIFIKAVEESSEDEK